jgi:SAM-dependent methyltransferase
VSAYGRDLAYVHDVGFGDFALNAAPGLLDLLRQAGIHDGLVVDLGCGSGIWARALHAAGYEVLGVDISKEMLEIARERVPGGRFVQASLHEAELPPCAAITSIGECAGYAFDGAASASDALSGLFAGAFDALRPGGLLVLDLAEPGREPPRESARRARHGGEGWRISLTAWEDGGRLFRDIELERDEGGRRRASRELHELVLHRREDVLGALEAAGFEARVLEGYGEELRFPPGLAGYAARKPD